MGLVVWAGIDDRHLVFTNQIRIRARPGHHAGIGGGDADETFEQLIGTPSGRHGSGSSVGNGDRDRAGHEPADQRSTPAATDSRYPGSPGRSSRTPRPSTTIFGTAVDGRRAADATSASSSPAVANLPIASR